MFKINTQLYTCSLIFVLQFLWSVWTYVICGEEMEMEDMIVIFYRVRPKLLGFLLDFLPPRLILITCSMLQMEEGTGIIL
jgi:hypothetical protein